MGYQKADAVACEVPLDPAVLGSALELVDRADIHTSRSCCPMTDVRNTDRLIKASTLARGVSIYGLSVHPQQLLLLYVTTDCCRGQGPGGLKQ